MTNLEKRVISILLAMTAALTASQVSMAQSESESSVVNLEEIIVTANRREQNIQDVSGVVQTLSADELDRSAITEFRQLQLAVPGMNIANQ